MIRREQTSAAGQPQWLLIPQITHAILAGELAGAWQWAAAGLGTGAPSGVALEEFLAAIVHHDDGWSAWDQNPRRDSSTGRPLNFTEMPVAESIAIWTASIDVAQQIGPLATYMVAGHFRALLQRHDRWRSRSETERRAGEGFLSFAEEQMARVVGQRSSSQSGAADEQDLCLQWLQFFDALSLWFCVAPRRQPQSFATPDRPNLTFMPLDRNRVVVTPWPFVRSSLTVGVEAFEIPATPLTAANLNLARILERKRLSWQLESHLDPGESAPLTN